MTWDGSTLGFGMVLAEAVYSVGLRKGQGGCGGRTVQHLDSCGHN